MLTLHIFPLRRGPPSIDSRTRLQYPMCTLRRESVTLLRYLHPARVTPSSSLRRIYRTPGSTLFLITTSCTTTRRFRARILQIFKYTKRNIQKYLFFSHNYKTRSTPRKYLNNSLQNFKQLYYLFTRDGNSHWKSIERTINYLLQCSLYLMEEKPRR